MGVPNADVEKSKLGSFMRGLDGARRTYVQGAETKVYSFASLKTWLWVAHHTWEVEQPWRRMGDAMTMKSQEPKGTNPTEDPQRVSCSDS